MAEFLLELLFQAVFELIAEGLVQLGAHSAAAIARHRAVRYVLATVVGFGFGAWWGNRLALLGRDDLPRLFAVSLALAILAAAGAAYRMRREREELGTGRLSGRFAVLVVPWRWDAGRLLGFAALNVAIAVGIAVGFDPLPG